MKRVVAGLTIVCGTCYAATLYVPHDDTSMLLATLGLAAGLMLGAVIALREVRW